MLRRIRLVWRSQGVQGLLATIGRRIVRSQARCFAQCVQLAEGREGLEIGGPSGIFARGGSLPVYPLVRSLDNCNFSGKTIWEGRLREGKSYVFDELHEPGFQFVSEATELTNIPSGKYDLVLSSHALEHIANPIKALHEWIRILKEQGVLLLIVPHKDRTFDHRRPVTDLEHMTRDYENDTKEDDLTHLSEILALHDLTRDPDAGGRAKFEKRCRENLKYRAMHHHVFDTRLVIALISHVRLKIIAVERLRPHHIVVVAQKLPPAGETDNGRTTSGFAVYPKKSPFPSDNQP